jgi:hypothetical protein
LAVKLGRRGGFSSVDTDFNPKKRGNQKLLGKLNLRKAGEVD